MRVISQFLGFFRFIYELLFGIGEVRKFLVLIKT